MLGRFDFERISKLVLRLLRTAMTKLLIGISVQQQYAYILAGRILRYIDDGNNKLYSKIIDDLNVIVQARVR